MPMPSMPPATDVPAIDPVGSDRSLSTALRDRVRSAEQLLVCTDFDGTLAEITENPDRASIRTDARRALRALVAAPATTVAVVSGRALSDVRERVDLDRVWYAGNHGLEIDVGDDRFVHPTAREARNSIEMLCERIRDDLAAFDGAIIENKGLTATVHYRMVDERAVDRVRETVRDAVGDVEDVDVTDGRQIVELRPAVDWDKGRAIEWLTATAAADGNPYRLYFGDDVSDEAGFRVLSSREAGIRVGDRTTDTAADYRVPDPSTVAALLHRVAGIRLGEL